MTFLYSFFSDSTAFILSVDIHHLFDMICTPYPWPTRRCLLQAVPTVATEKCKSDFFFFFFLIHSYTYVVPISPVPKYSGGLSLRKKCLERFKSTPLIVYGTYATGRNVRFASAHLCAVSLWAAVVGLWRHKQQVHKVSVCLCQVVRSVVMIVFVVLLFGL